MADTVPHCEVVADRTDSWMVEAGRGEGPAHRMDCTPPSWAEVVLALLG